jgi:1,4-dihydroxy-2-naphthoyl-CoA synthase
MRFHRNDATLTIVIEQEFRHNAPHESIVASIIAGLDEAKSDRSVRATVDAGDKTFCVNQLADEPKTNRAIAKHVAPRNND